MIKKTKIPQQKVISGEEKKVIYKFSLKLEKLMLDRAIYSANLIGLHIRPQVICCLLSVFSLVTCI